MIVKVVVAKDENWLTYISMIRSYSKELSIGEIKKKIEHHEPVLAFDTYGYDFVDEYTAGLTEDDYLFGFYHFLEALQNHGACLQILMNDEEGSMEALYQRLESERELRLELETYPD